MTPPLDAALRGHTRALLSLWRPDRAGPPDRLTHQELREVAQAVKRLSAGLSGERTKAGRDYLGTEDGRTAYLLHFWPVSYAQTRAALQLAGLRPPAGGGRVLELGAGPGPGAMALLDEGWGELHCGDRNPDALLSLRALTRDRASTFLWDGEAEGGALPPGELDLIFASHVVSELWKRAPDRIERRLATLQRLLGRLRPGGHLLLIEPATHALNAELLTLRDAAAAADLVITAPCVPQGPCPALAEGVACHAATRWTPPPLTEQLTRAAFITKDAPAFSYLCLAAAPPPHAPPPGAIRVISERLTNKAGRERVVTCGAEGRRSLSAAPGQGESWREAWRRLGRGDGLVVEGAEVRETGLGLTAASRVRPWP
ncbi:methyltransferase type 12 [Myxococcota bacterium]|nr:methyltransferase type 12 [Myxococcota bacterium]